MKCTIHSDTKLSPQSKALLLDFVKFCKNKLEINSLPESIILFKSRDEQHGMTTGGYDPHSMTITVLAGRRLLLDILRSVAHELTHHKQNERGNLLEMVDEYDTDLNTPYENEAYERSGNLIKEWTRIVKEKHPNIYDLYVV